jgi:two-component system, NtrC family, nitrogen regulation response regulator GlnG
MSTRGIRSAIRESLIVGDSAEMAEVVARIEELADNDAPVLIEGERGTGRERVARSIHYASARRGCDFVAVKAESIPKAMISDELFGVRSGTLRRAQGGTLLVKDVATLPKGPQRGLAKVLKRRERGRSERSDDSTGENFDVRVIGASDGELETAVNADSFDRELYDHLGARKIHIPPLRRRLADLPRLTRHFLKEAGEEIGHAAASVSTRALDRLAVYPWPGNVAELKDLCRKLVAAHKRGSIDVDEVDALLPQPERIPIEDMAIEELVRSKLKGFLRSVGDYPVENLYDDIIARVERPLLALVMEHAGGNQLRASEILGINRNTLRKKLAQHGIGETPAKKR